MFGESTKSRRQVQMWYNPEDVNDYVLSLLTVHISNREKHWSNEENKNRNHSVYANKFLTVILDMKHAVAKIVSKLQNFEETQLHSTTIKISSKTS